MSQRNHDRAAELHNLAAHAHSVAAVAHGKEDHLTAHELSQQAHEHSMNAHRLAEELSPKKIIKESKRRSAVETRKRIRLPCHLALQSREDTSMTHNTARPMGKLPNAPQAPLSRPGAAPDSDRAKRPPLTEPTASGPQLNPGDRVEGLGDFGKPTGDFGTVEQSNDEDALVKWDNDGRAQLHLPWLRKI